MVKNQNLCFKGIKTVTCHCEKLSEKALNNNQGMVIRGYNLTVVRCVNHATLLAKNELGKYELQNI